MSLLTRALQKIFGDTGGTGEFGQIGSKAAGSPTTTKNLETMQALSQYDLGMNAIVSEQGTSVLPYLEDINSLFFLTTSQLAYLFQSGVPEWDDATEYYQEVSLAADEGMIWKDIYGTVGTPNLNNQPSINQDKWQPVAAAVKKQSIAASGALTLGYSNWKVEVDTSGGAIAISALPTPNFPGQKLHIYVSGTNEVTVAAGTGILAVTITSNSDTGSALFESVDNGGTLEWRIVPGVTPPNLIAYTSDGAAPAGWSEYTAGRGRMIVGLPSGGTNEGTVGTALTDLQNKTHTHIITNHIHRVYDWTNGSIDDVYDASGVGQNIVNASQGERGLDVSNTGAENRIAIDMYSEAETNFGSTGTSNISSILAWIQLMTIKKD